MDRYPKTCWVRTNAAPDRRKGHDGANAFKFRVAFREAIKIDFRIFWDHSLTVTGRLCAYRREFFPEA